MNSDFKRLQDRLKNKLYNWRQDYHEATDYGSLIEDWDKLQEVALKRQFLRTTRNVDSLINSLLISIKILEKQTTQESITALHEIRRNILGDENK